MTTPWVVDASECSWSAPTRSATATSCDKCGAHATAPAHVTLSSVTTRPVGPPAYVAAHRIAVVDGRLPFEHAYCLSRLVVEHGGGPFPPEPAGTMSWKVFKALASEELVFVTSELSDGLRPDVELTISALFIEEFGSTPPAGVRINGFITSRRRKIDRYITVAAQGADLVAAAVRAVAHDHGNDGRMDKRPSSWPPAQSDGALAVQ